MADIQTRRLDGKALSLRLEEELTRRAAACRQAGVEPCLAVVLVGEDPASQVYVRNKGRAAARVGIETRDHRLAADTTRETLLALVASLNEDPGVHGILVQLPLPEHLDADEVLLAIDPRKDVDGFHPYNLGRLLMGDATFVACTPQGCMRLLDEAGVELSGARALVLGRSTIVGKPMAQLLLQANATVTVAHSRTRDLEAEIGRADVLIAAVGREKMVKGQWLKPGCTVIDVGINRNPEDGKLYGDVDYDGAQGIAAAITPVPGGVGPMTISCLLANVIQAAEIR